MALWVDIQLAIDGIGSPADDLEVVTGYVCSNYGDRVPHLQVRDARNPHGPCHDCRLVVVIRRREGGIER